MSPQSRAALSVREIQRKWGSKKSLVSLISKTGNGRGQVTSSEISYRVLRKMKVWSWWCQMTTILTQKCVFYNFDLTFLEYPHNPHICQKWGRSQGRGSDLGPGPFEWYFFIFNATGLPWLGRHLTYWNHVDQGPLQSLKIELPYSQSFFKFS